MYLIVTNFRGHVISQKIKRHSLKDFIFVIWQKIMLKGSKFGEIKIHI